MDLQNQSLATDIKTAKNKISAFWRSLFGEKDDFNKVAYMSNPESIGDELLVLFWLVVAVASGFTFYYGFRYHLSIFEGNGDWEALTVSTAIFIVGEILKVMVGHRFFRAVFSGLFMRSLAALFLVVGMGILAYFTYEWSVGISSKGYAAVVAQKARQEAFAQTGNYSAVTAPYDAQIAEAQKTIAAGRKVTWAGKVTSEGQQLIKSGQKTLNKLNDDRQKAIETAQKRDTAALALSGALIKVKEDQQNQYGGMAEKVVAFVLLLICLIEVINYRQFQKKGGTQLPKQAAGIGFGLPARHPSPIAEERPKIGFQYGGAAATGEAKKTVITEPKAVITEKSEKNDLIAEGIRKQIQSINSECSHYEKNNGDRHRIAQRIGAKTNTLRELVIQHKDEIPDSVFENFQKAHARAKAILLAHKEGGDV